MSSTLNLNPQTARTELQQKPRQQNTAGAFFALLYHSMSRSTCNQDLSAKKRKKRPRWQRHAAAAILDRIAEKAHQQPLEMQRSARQHQMWRHTFGVWNADAALRSAAYITHLDLSLFIKQASCFSSSAISLYVPEKRKSFGLLYSASYHPAWRCASGILSLFLRLSPCNFKSFLLTNTGKRAMLFLSIVGGFAYVRKPLQICVNL